MYLLGSYRVGLQSKMGESFTDSKTVGRGDIIFDGPILTVLCQPNTEVPPTTDPIRNITDIIIIKYTL